MVFQRIDDATCRDAEERMKRKIENEKKRMSFLARSRGWSNRVGRKTGLVQPLVIQREMTGRER
jgi:hypothetical protein